MSARPIDIQQRIELETRIKLAADGKYKCNICSKTAPQDEGVIVAFQGSPLLTVCPTCIPGAIIIQRHPQGISVVMPNVNKRKVLLPDELPRMPGMRPAAPQIEKLKISND